MAIDDSFKKPGSIPFKWEIRPGIPKLQHQSSDLHRPFAKESRQQNHGSSNQNGSFPQKLRPPPAGFSLQPLPELRTKSFRSAPRTRSDRYRSDRAILNRPDITVSTNCLPSTLLWQRYGKKRTQKPKSEPASESDCISDLESPSRWSVSTRKSLSPFRGSPSSASISSSSNLSSPRPVCDPEWAGFGLF